MEKSIGITNNSSEGSEPRTRARSGAATRLAAWGLIALLAGPMGPATGAMAGTPSDPAALEAKADPANGKPATKIESAVDSTGKHANTHGNAVKSKVGEVGRNISEKAKSLGQQVSRATTEGVQDLGRHVGELRGKHGKHSK